MDWKQNRLVRVVHTVGSSTEIDVSYTYDSIGRLLTRKLSTDANPTRFEWDGWDLVQEVDPAGVETVYYAPRGYMWALRIGAERYQLHSDHNSSIRAITDDSGTPVAEYSFDAWGQTLSASGSVFSGLALRPLYVGALGIRSDSATQLQYVRQRWYDADLQMFISRDQLRNVNRYAFCGGDPLRYVDWNGMDFLGLEDWGQGIEEFTEENSATMAWYTVIEMGGDKVTVPRVLDAWNRSRARSSGFAAPNPYREVPCEGFDNCYWQCMSRHGFPVTPLGVVGAAGVSWAAPRILQAKSPFTPSMTIWARGIYYTREFFDVFGKGYPQLLKILGNRPEAFSWLAAYHAASATAITWAQTSAISAVTNAGKMAPPAFLAVASTYLAAISSRCAISCGDPDNWNYWKSN